MVFATAVDDLAIDDIQSLVDREVAEGKTVEYKEILDLDANSYEHKQKLIGEVVSFADDHGGYFIIGVIEDGGVPQTLPGMAVDDPDAVKERWGNVIRDNTEPQLPPSVFDIASIHVEADNYLFIIEIDQSWRAPHRETMNNIFYARSPSGRIELNVEEIRRRMTDADTTDRVDDLKQIRNDRLTIIRDRDGIAAQLDAGPTTVVHLLPETITRHSEHIPADELPQPQPLGETRNGDDMTAEARYSWTLGDDDWAAYGLLQNNGLYEAAGQTMFSRWDDETLIQSKVTSGNMGLDAAIIVAIKRGLNALAQLDFAGNNYAFISLLDAAEYKLDDRRGLPSELLPGSRSIGTDEFTTPPIELAPDTDTVAPALEHAIDTIYHQMGWEDGSPNYSDGEWTGGSVTINREELL